MQYSNGGECLYHRHHLRGHVVICVAMARSGALCATTDTDMEKSENCVFRGCDSIIDSSCNSDLKNEKRHIASDVCSKQTPILEL